MQTLEKKRGNLSDEDIVANIEGSLKGAVYMHVRYLYNNVDKYKITEPVRTALFLFIRNYAYSGMFRYHSNGGFNVPYGGIDYNKKDFRKKVNYLKSNELKSHLANTSINCLDF